MNVIAIQSSGNQTSLCAIIKDDVVQYSIKHERKERPNWSEMLINIGLDSFFTLEVIDVFAYANNSNSYTATRSVAAYLKGITSAISKPLIIIDSDDVDNLDADAVAKKAIEKYLNTKNNLDSFKPDTANPIYSSIPQYKKVNE
jgi:tRNA A37 threonylcarbamoyladenosine modification protein TsaB